MRISPVLIFIFCLKSLMFSQQTFAVTENELQKIIECKSDYDTYEEVWDNHKTILKKLGWTDTSDPDSITIYTYEHIKPIEIFNKSTQKIGILGGGIVAYFPKEETQPLSQLLNISNDPKLESTQFFVGEKLINSQKETKYKITVHKKIIMIGLDDIAIGCNFQFDHDEVEKRARFEQ